MTGTRIIVKNLPLSISEAEIKSHFESKGNVTDVRLVKTKEGLSRRFAYIGYETEQDAHSALRYFDQTYIRTSKLQVEFAHPPQRDSNDNAEQLWKTSRLFLRNLSFSCQDRDLKQAFEQYGPISELSLPITSQGQSKGFAHISFDRPEHAFEAFRSMNGKVFQGRILWIQPSEPKRTADPDEPQTYKATKLAHLRQNAWKPTNWNTFFVNSNAVVDTIIRELGISKSEFLDDKIDNLAARVALAETHIISDTKRYFQEQGIELDATNVLVRSQTMILIKNIPYDTAEAELADLFGKYGSISRIILPPTKATAIVDFALPAEAKRAFSGLAYRKFKHLPLYLEWVPEGVINYRSPARISLDSTTPHSDSVKTSLDSSTIDPENKPSHTLFVKNLGFITTEIELERIFANEQGFVKCAIAKKRNTKTNVLVSLGYGFVEFQTPMQAQMAKEKPKGIVLNDHLLVLEFSHPKPSEQASLTKIVIRNVPFEATLKDISELFHPFGDIRKIRLPVRMDKRPRGFAFVEFSNEKDANCAFDSLRHTHLYGRHLVLEWAKEPSLEELRLRSMHQVQNLKTAPKKSTHIVLEESEQSSEE